MELGVHVRLQIHLLIANFYFLNTSRSTDDLIVRLYRTKPRTSLLWFSYYWSNFYTVGNVPGRTFFHRFGGPNFNLAPVVIIGAFRRGMGGWHIILDDIISNICLSLLPKLKVGGRCTNYVLHPFLFPLLFSIIFKFKSFKIVFVDRLLPYLLTQFFHT